jgi:hypothetical protein
VEGAVDRGNPANNARRNAYIVVEHPGRRFLCHVYVRQGSAAVKVGQRVKAGDVLGRLDHAGANGNARSARSSEDQDGNHGPDIGATSTRLCLVSSGQFFRLPPPEESGIQGIL